MYSSNEELLAQGLDPAHLIGLIHEDDEDGDENERNMFSYKNNFGKFVTASVFVFCFFFKRFVVQPNKNVWN